MSENFTDRAGNANPDDRFASMQAVWQVIFRHRFLIMVVFVGIVAIVTISALVMKPVFQASAKILVVKNADTEKSLLFRMNLAPDYERYNWIKAETEIITSTPVAFAVIKQLKLDQVEFKESDANIVLSAFKANLKVKNAEETNVIDISYDSEYPELAAAVVNKLVTAYAEYRDQMFSESEQYHFFDDQIRLAEEKLQELEQRLTNFKQTEEIISPQAQINILLAKIADYEKALTQARTRRIGKEAMLAVIKEQVQKGAGANVPVTESSDSPSREKFIAKLRGDLLDLELKRDQLLQKFTPEYEEVVHLENALASTRKRIENEVNEIVELEETAIRALRAEEQVLQQTINDLTGQIRVFAQKEYELTQQSRGIEDNREIYSMLLKQREEARISQAKLERGIKIKVISPALAPSAPFKPKKKFKVMLGMVLGLVSGVGLAFLMDNFAPSSATRHSTVRPHPAPVGESADRTAKNNRLQTQNAETIESGFEPSVTPNSSLGSRLSPWSALQHKLARIIKLASVSSLVIGVGVSVWLFNPKNQPRPLLMKSHSVSLARGTPDKKIKAAETDGRLAQEIAKKLVLDTMNRKIWLANGVA